MSAFKLPAEEWDTLTIDGRECKACFGFKGVAKYDRHGNWDGERTVCWMELPRCQCPECNVYCGSEVTGAEDFPGVTFKTTGEPLPRQCGCIYWNLEEACDPCG